MSSSSLYLNGLQNRPHRPSPYGVMFRGPMMNFDTRLCSDPRCPTWRRNVAGAFMAVQCPSELTSHRKLAYQSRFGCKLQKQIFCCQSQHISCTPHPLDQILVPFLSYYCYDNYYKHYYQCHRHYYETDVANIILSNQLT